MVDLSAHKVPIFTGVNDAPVVPTSTKGGNASDLIKRHNDLIDAVTPELGGSSSRPTTYHVVNANLYVNSSTGLDTNPGTSASPIATVAKALEIIKSKCITESFFLYLEGTFADVDLDFTGVYGGYGFPKAILYVDITGTLKINNLSKAEDFVQVNIQDGFTVLRPLFVNGGIWQIGNLGGAGDTIINETATTVQSLFTFLNATVYVSVYYDTATNGGQAFESLFEFIDSNVIINTCTFNNFTTGRALGFFSSYAFWNGSISGTNNTGTDTYALLSLMSGSTLNKGNSSFTIVGNIGVDITSRFIGQISIPTNTNFVIDDSFKLLTFEGVIATPAIQDYTRFVRSLPENATNLLYVQAQTDSGSCNISVKTSAGVTLYGTVTANTTLLNQRMTTRKVVNFGESITITVSSNTSATNLWIRLIFGI